jgi:hypothetical protein
MPAPPIALTDDQLDIIRRAAEPLHPHDRGAYLETVAELFERARAWRRRGGASGAGGAAAFLARASRCIDAEADQTFTGELTAYGLSTKELLGFAAENVLCEAVIRRFANANGGDSRGYDPLKNLFSFGLIVFACNRLQMNSAV